jgi:hypothetical protein
VNCPFQFQKRGQLIIRTYNETLSVVAMSVRNPDRSPASMIPLPKCRMIRHNSLMTPLLSGDCQGDEAGNVIETHEHAGEFKEF